MIDLVSQETQFCFEILLRFYMSFDRKFFVLLYMFEGAKVSHGGIELLGYTRLKGPINEVKIKLKTDISYSNR